MGQLDVLLQKASITPKTTLGGTKSTGLDSLLSTGIKINPPSAKPAPKPVAKPTSVVKKEDKRLDFGRIKTAITSSVKTIPGTVKVAAGIIGKSLIDQQRTVNDFFKKLPPVFTLPQVTLQEKILKPLVPKAEKGLANLREQGTKEIIKAREPFAKLPPAKNNLQKYAELIAFNLPQMAASMALTIGTAIVTKNRLAATAVGLSTSYGLGASEVYEEARNQGVKDDKATALSMIGGAVIGALDFVSLGRLIRKTGVAEEVKRSIIKKVANGIVSIGKQATFEGVTEQLQEIVGNAVAKTYNEKRNLLEGVTEAGIVGLFLGGLGDISVQGVVTLGGKSKNPVKAVEEVKKKIVEAVETKATDRTPEQEQIVETIFQPNMTQDQAVGTMLSLGLEKTKAGKEFIKTTFQPEQQGQDIQIKTPKPISEIKVEEQRGKRVLNTKEVVAIKEIIDTKLTQIRETTGNAGELLNQYEKFYNDIIDKANNDKVVLSALRTTLSKEMFGLAGATGENYKANYAQLQTVISQDQELGPVLNKLEDYIAEIDKKLLTAQEPARIKPNIEIKKTPSEKRATTPSKEEPVGTGKPKNSRLFERVKETLGAEYEAQNRKYNVLDLEQQAEAVVKLIEENPARATKIARGLIEPPPGMTQNSIAIALADIARESGDFKTAAELWTKTSLRSTRLGQEIVSLRGGFGTDGPLNAVKQVLDIKMQQVVRRYNDIIKGLSISEKAPIGEKIDALLTHEAKKLKQKINSKLQSADAIFAQLTCK